jgi:hypothetical protein
MPLETTGQTPPYANGGQTLYYIDVFAWAARHEKAHHDAYHAWWTTGTPPRSWNRETTDQDGDYIPDVLEPQMSTSESGPYNPKTAYSFGIQELEDTERYICVAAEVWVPRRTGPGGSDPNDWAKPGNNWPE